MCGKLKSTEDSLNSNEYFKIFKNMPYDVILLDKNDKIVDLNYKANNTFKNIDLQSYIYESLIEIKKDNSYRVPTAYGIKHFKVDKISLDESEKSAYYAIILNNISEYDKLKEDYKKLNDNVGKLLNNINYYIRNFMNNIIGATELTLMDNINVEQGQNLNLIKSSSLTLLNKIDIIIDFYKLQFSKIKIESEEFNFQNFIDEIVGMVNAKVICNNLKFKAEIGEDIPKILVGDIEKLKRILMWLMESVIRFTEHGIISFIIENLHSSQKKVDLRIEIKTSRVIMHKKDMVKSFKDVADLKNGNCVNIFSDSWLELYVIKEFIKAMGIEIKVKSIKNVGTSFSFDLSLQVKDESNSVNTDTSLNENIMSRIMNKKLNILIIEDDRVGQNVLCKLLKKYGHTYSLANNDRKVLTAVKNNKYDLILMDIQMPIMDGIQVTKYIRRLEKKKNIYTPIIVLTPYYTTTDRQKFLNTGIDDYICKPFSINKLFKVIYKVVKSDEENLYCVNKKDAINDDMLFLYPL